ncbi:hypothetical protein BpHYR1_007199 [Brachionus plicatilis]|uniref:Uncharacterized protein n=1 Tax=Brachionus plicatilis TaxID=10195 RepID=A0A3M7QXZ5_BRAPC|nr:hypothetical protein BpHYR1_007199 [Brachionus plicatilis]
MFFLENPTPSEFLIDNSTFFHRLNNFSVLILLLTKCSLYVDKKKNVSKNFTDDMDLFSHSFIHPFIHSRLFTIYNNSIYMNFITFAIKETQLYLFKYRLTVQIKLDFSSCSPNILIIKVSYRLKHDLLENNKDKA